MRPITQSAAVEVRLLDAMFRADIDDALSVFEGEPVLDLPRFGRVEGKATLSALITQEWTRSFNCSPAQRVTERFECVSGNGAVVEVFARVTGPQGEIDLPIAIVGERAPSGRLKAVRLYHAVRPVTGVETFRSNPFPPREDARPMQPDDLPDINSVYFRGLSTQDLELVMRAFNEDAVIEAGVLRVSSRDNVRAFYRRLMERKPLLYASLKWDDGRTFALEWTSGKPRFEGGPLYSGLAAYMRAADGLIGHIRMYDDNDLSQAPGVVTEPVR